MSWPTPLSLMGSRHSCTPRSSWTTQSAADERYAHRRAEALRHGSHPSSGGGGRRPPRRRMDVAGGGHVPSQPWAFAHVRVHWRMLTLVLRTRDRTEASGQVSASQSPLRVLFSAGSRWATPDEPMSGSPSPCPWPPISRHSYEGRAGQGKTNSLPTAVALTRRGLRLAQFTVAYNVLGAS